jgi:hypothetical protein
MLKIQTNRLKIGQIATVLASTGMMLPLTIAPMLTVQAIAPAALAQAAPMTLNLPTRQGEDYGRLVRRAEVAARRAAQQIFNTNPINEIALTVVGENQNLAAPLLTMQVTRADWLRSPDPRQWSTYYRTAEGLLQLQPTAVTQPTPEPAASTPSPTDAPTLAPTDGEPAGTTVRESGNTPLPPAASGTSLPAEDVPTGTPPVINIPAAPAGQLGLPRSILR